MRHVAVEQDRIDRKPAHLAFHLGDLIRGAEVRRAGREAARISLRPLADHYLRRLVTLEYVGEVVDRRAVHDRKVRHVRDVVDQLAAVGVDGPLLDHPVAPFVGEACVDARNRNLGRRRAVFRIVPHEQQLVLLASRPCLHARLGRDSFAYGILLHLPSAPQLQS